MGKVYTTHDEVLKALAAGEIKLDVASALLGELTAKAVSAAKPVGVKAFKISALAERFHEKTGRAL